MGSGGNVTDVSAKLMSVTDSLVSCRVLCNADANAFYIVALQSVFSIRIIHFCL